MVEVAAIATRKVVTAEPERSIYLVMGVFVKTADEWVNLETGANGGELPGIGGWCQTLLAVTGLGTKYEYTSDGQDWSAWEWTTDGSVTVSGGLVDTLHW